MSVLAEMSAPSRRHLLPIWEHLLQHTEKIAVFRDFHRVSRAVTGWNSPCFSLVHTSGPTMQEERENRDESLKSEHTR